MRPRRRASEPRSSPASPRGREVHREHPVASRRGVRALPSARRGAGVEHPRPLGNGGERARPAGQPPRPGPGTCPSVAPTQRRPPGRATDSRRRTGERLGGRGRHLDGLGRTARRGASRPAARELVRTVTGGGSIVRPPASPRRRRLRPWRRGPALDFPASGGLARGPRGAPARSDSGGGGLDSGAGHLARHGVDRTAARDGPGCFRPLDRLGAPPPGAGPASGRSGRPDARRGQAPGHSSAGELPVRELGAMARSSASRRPRRPVGRAR